MSIAPLACVPISIPILIPVPISIMLTWVARLSLQCRLIPHSSVISERSSSSNSSRLMSWVSLEGVEMVQSPTVQVAGRRVQGSILPAGSKQYCWPKEMFFWSLLERQIEKGAPSREDEFVTTKWLGLAWSVAVGSQCD